MSRPFTVVAIVAAFNEDDIIGQAVKALIDDGVQVYFLDHRSTDRTRAEVERFLNQGVIGVETFPAGGTEDAAAHSFAWGRILKRKEELAREIDADWFIHHDADEFREGPWAGQSLRESIERVDALGYNAIDFQVLNFFPTNADPVEATDIQQRLLFYEPGRVFDRQQTKCWKNTRHPVELASSGGHSVEFPGRRIFPIRFMLRHYPIRSQAHGERKVLRERRPRFDAGERALGWHVQYDDLGDMPSFVRDAATLIRYNADEARFDLLLHNREFDRLEQDVAGLEQDVAARQAEIEAMRAELAERDAAIAQLLNSRSWKVTAPLRAADRLLRGATKTRQDD